MARLKLVIGNKNYSSWSLRPWILMKQAAIAFDEVRLPLYQPESRAKLLAYSPAGKVPVLVDGDVTVWDSLAICEYLAECHPGKNLWPAQSAARAHARAISAEMHSGFSSLRQHMSMNCRRRFPGKGRNAEVEADIRRITGMWDDCRSRYGAGGPFLFGAFSTADAMYAPVVLRFRTYAVTLPPAPQAYADAIEALPAMQEWLVAAQAEPEVLPQYEMYSAE